MFNCIKLKQMASFQYNLFSGLVSKLPEKVKLNVLYFRRFYSLINFNTPTTFNEKIQVRKIKDRNPLLTIGADKLESKLWVSKVTPEIYIPKTLWEGSSSDDVLNIDYNEFPDNYVIKANHTSQTIKIIREGKHIPLDSLKRTVSNWLAKDQSSVLGEWAYKNIPRKVFVEEFLDFEGKAPDDYKFFVYNGEVKFIQVDFDRFLDHKRNMFNANWQDLEFSYSHNRKLPTPPRPDFLDEMIAIANRIGKYFSFVRVDLYFYDGKVTFGELTFYPGAGFERFPDKQYDKLFGDNWII